MMLAKEMLTETEDMRKSIDSIKDELRLNPRGPVCRGRQTGKTIALMEYIHEKCAGDCFLVTVNINIAKLLERKYREMFPKDTRPTFLSYYSLRDVCVAGTNKEWATDEIWPESVVKENENFRFLNFLGGVGTPMCMDLHSR